MRSVRVSMLVIVLAMALSVPKATAAEWRQGVQFAATSNQLLLEMIGELLFTGFEARVGVTLIGYDPYEEPDEILVINGLSFTGTWVYGDPGPGGSKLTVGIGNRYMIDESDYIIQVYPEIGFVHWGDSVRFKVAVGGGAEFSYPRFGPGDWSTDWLALFMLSLSGG